MWPRAGPPLSRRRGAALPARSWPHNGSERGEPVEERLVTPPYGASAGSRRSTRWLGVAEGLDLCPRVDLGVAVRRGEVGVSEPAADHVHFDAGLEQVHR